MGYQIDADCINLIREPGLKDFSSSQFYCYMNAGQSVQTYETNGQDSNLCNRIFDLMPIGNILC